MESLVGGAAATGHGYPQASAAPAAAAAPGLRSRQRPVTAEAASVGVNAAPEDFEIRAGKSGASSQHGADGGILRKKLYDQNLSDWSARYRKNKANLDNVLRDCDSLRSEVARYQQEVDEREELLRNLEDRYQNEVYSKFNDAKGQFMMAAQHKGMLATQLSESRKHKANLQREKKQLQADYDRKHAELMRKTEVRDKLGQQLDQTIQQLSQLNRDRQRIERELDEVNQNLKAHSELADEVNMEIGNMQDGIRDSVELHMAGAARPELSTSSQGPAAAPQLPPDVVCRVPRRTSATETTDD